MQSLIQPEILDELSRRLNLEADKLSSQVQTILALALTEKHVTNERLRFVLRLHKSDITSLLQQMCKQGWLVSDGYGRGTKYRLPSEGAIDNVVSNNNNVDRKGPNVDRKGPNVDRKGPNVDRKGPNVDSLESNVDSSESNVDSSEDNINIIFDASALSDEARVLLNRKRLSQSQMETLICEIAYEWRTIQDLTYILRKDKSYLRNHVLPNLISKGILEREYASIPNHPNQRYRIKQA